MVGAKSKKEKTNNAGWSSKIQRRKDEEKNMLVKKEFSLVFILENPMINLSIQFTITHDLYYHLYI